MIELKKVQIKLRTSQKKILLPFSLQLCAGQLLAVRGPSGCGKSTLLSFLAGFIDRRVFQVEGELFLFGKKGENVLMSERGVGFLSQDYLLFPHLTVAENLIFVMPARMTKKERQIEANESLQEAGLAGMNDRLPNSLSGGEQARVALLCALVRRPKYLLLDEPFTRLDVARRQDFRAFVFRYLQKKNLPAVMVTHDEEDLLPLKKKSVIKQSGMKQSLVLREALWGKTGLLKLQ